MNMEKIVVLLIMCLLLLLSFMQCMMTMGIRRDVNILMGQVRMMHQLPLP